MQIQKQSLVKDNSYIRKLYFTQCVFGKPSKIQPDHSMFQILQWNSNGIEQATFKKNQRFKSPQLAYMQMIAKNPWTTQSSQNFMNYFNNSIQVNQNRFQQVQKYIKAHQSNQNKYLKKVSKKNINKQLTDYSQQMIHTQNQSKKNKINSNNKIFSSRGQQKKGTQKNIDPNQNKINQNNHSIKRIQSAKNISVNNMQNSFQNQDDFNQRNRKNKNNQIFLKPQITPQQQQKLIDQFKQTTRWISNSAFSTYFGKPPFENYGRGNTRPIDGGLVYGTYLYSHSVYPHRGKNKPSKIQTYPVALMKAQSAGKLVPTQPKTACKYIENKINNQKQKIYDNKVGQIQALPNTFGYLEIETPDLHGVQKFGGTKKTTVSNFYNTNNNQKKLKKSSKRIKTKQTN